MARVLRSVCVCKAGSGGRGADGFRVAVPLRPLVGIYVQRVMVFIDFVNFNIALIYYYIQIFYNSSAMKDLRILFKSIAIDSIV